MTEFMKDSLRVQVYATRAEMGRAAARDVEAAIAQALREKGRCNMIFAAAPSQTRCWRPSPPAKASTGRACTRSTWTSTSACRPQRRRVCEFSARGAV